MEAVMPTRFVCPHCGRFIGATDGTYLDARPCTCGWQTTVKFANADKKKPLDKRQERRVDSKAS